MKPNFVMSLPLERPVLTLLASLCLCIAVGSGLSRVTFSNDYRDYFSEENPQLSAWEEIQDVYTKTDNILIAVTPKNGDVFNTDTLTVLQQLTELGWQFPYATRVDSITNFQHVRGDPDTLIIESLVDDASTLATPDLATLRTVTLGEPTLVNRLVSPTGHVAAVNVTLTLAANPRSQIAEAATHAYELIAEMEGLHPSLAFHVTGAVPYNHALANATKQDLLTLVPVMYLVIFMLVGILLRSVGSLIVLYVSVTVSVAMALAATAWAQLPLTGASVSAPTIVLTLAVANAVHLLVNFYYEYRDGISRTAAMRESLRINAMPILIANCSTAIGFLTMNFSDVPPYRDLGNMVAIGITVALLVAFFVLPALVAIIPLRRRPHLRKERKLFTRIAEFSMAKRAVLCTVLGIISLACLYGTTKLTINDLFVEWLDESYTFRTDTDYIGKELAGIYRLDYSLSSGESHGVSNPEYLQVVDSFAEWFREQSGVVHVDSFTEIMKRLNRSMTTGEQDAYVLPASQELAAQFLLLYEMSLPQGLDLSEKVDIDKSSTRFNVSTRNLSTKELLSLEQSAQEWLRDNAPPSMSTSAASTTILFANISKRNVESLLGATVIAILIISLLLSVPLRSFKLGVLSIVPNILPAVIGFGLWGYFFSEVGLGISVVIGMTFGIVVDDTTHILSKYVRARRERADSPEQAIRYAYGTVGGALTKTTIVLAAGFAVLALSGFEINAEMGLLTAIVIIAAWVADFFVLPGLILAIAGATNEETESYKGSHSAEELELPSSERPALPL